MRKNENPLVVVDFDGVIHSYDSGWAGVACIPDGPVPGALEWLVAMYEGARLGIHPAFDLAIDSSRSKSLRGRSAMQQWLREHLHARYGDRAGPLSDPLYLDLVEWLRWPWFKPAAVLTIDDRAYRFDGDWAPLQPSAIAHFRPWNRGGSGWPRTVGEAQARKAEPKDPPRPAGHHPVA